MMMISLPELADVILWRWLFFDLVLPKVLQANKQKFERLNSSVIEFFWSYLSVMSSTASAG